MTKTRRLLAVPAAILVSLVLASSAFAHECTNASRSDPMAGALALIGPSGEVLWISQGLATRLANGVVDPATGEGLHGLIAIDFTGDGIADASTWVGVGPDGEVPLEAQFRGPACKGLTNIGVYLSQCFGV